MADKITTEVPRPNKLAKRLRTTTDGSNATLNHGNINMTDDEKDPVAGNQYGITTGDSLKDNNSPTTFLDIKQIPIMNQLTAHD
jgi:hypothetical protein